MASTGALAACGSQQPQKLIPYVVPPDDVIPGVATWYKSVCRECPAGCGTLVRTREGRVVKVEGNPDHPVNLGALCVRGQSAVQGLYNPDRLMGPMKRSDEGKFEPITWEQAEELLANTVRYLRYSRRAERMAFVTERVTGSTEKLLREWLDAAAEKQGLPRLIQYEPFAYEALRAANKICFGTTEIPHLHIGRAQMLLSFGADFLETYDSPVFHTRQFAIMREEFRNYAGRFVAVGPRLSLTAANADEFLRVPPESELFLAVGMLREILDAGLARIPAAEAAQLRALVGRFGEGNIAEQSSIATDRIRRIAREFVQAPRGVALGPGVASSGEFGTALQMVVNLLNYACGFVGDTVIFGRGANWDAVATHTQMFDFVRQMQAGEFDVAFFHRTNPAYSLPEAAGFRHALERVPFKVSFATAMDETAALCDLVLPDNTPLERWEDFTPRAGVYGLAQPAMRPGFHFNSKQTEDVLLAATARIGGEMAQRLNFPNFREYLRDQWRALHKQVGSQKDFEIFWREAVEAGGVWKDVPARPVKLSEEVFRFDFAAALGGRSFSSDTAAGSLVGRGFSRDIRTVPQKGALAPEGQQLTLVIYPRLELFDGRTANRPIIQETPDAMTKIVWDSWAEIHPETARQRGIADGDLLKITSPAGSIQIPAHLYEGIHPDAIAIPLGQGHTEGRWAQGRGPTPLRLLAAQAEKTSGGLFWPDMTVMVEKLAVNRPLARTQIETRQNPDGRDREIVQVVPLSALLKGEAPKKESHPALSLYPEHMHSGHRWGMAIDLNSCVGCNACIAACYAENNVTFVGKDQVNRGRHMAWIRLDRYFEEKKSGQLETRFMPMLCQQCDNAPCESVCPVYATYHNYEGLNVQVYNRCVGTRYCSNNCPYKVRRFNWWDYEWPWPMHLGLNPDLSARTKGVMEKCTFCIQRIRSVKDIAKDEKRDVRDGEIVPACAQTCPAQAITFGDLNDPKSRVAQMAQDGRSYHVLGELNTRPAISYLKKIVRDEKT